CESPRAAGWIRETPPSSLYRWFRQCGRWGKRGLDGQAVPQGWRCFRGQTSLPPLVSVPPAPCPGSKDTEPPRRNSRLNETKWKSRFCPTIQPHQRVCRERSEPVAWLTRIDQKATRRGICSSHLGR